MHTQQTLECTVLEKVVIISRDNKWFEEAIISEAVVTVSEMVD